MSHQKTIAALLTAGACALFIGPLSGCSGTPAAQPSVASAAPSTASPSPTRTEPSRKTLDEFCSTNFYHHLTAAADLVNKFADHPDGKGMTGDDFRTSRDTLNIDAQSAPEVLLPGLSDMTEILGEIADVFDTGNNKTIDTGKFADAGTSVINICTGDSADSTDDDPAVYTPHKSDWAVVIKVKKKQCFGSAGCIVTFRIKPSYKGSADLPASGVIDVTYKIRGCDDPYTNTFTVEDSTMSYDREEHCSTSASWKKLSASVTDVDYNA